MITRPQRERAMKERYAAILLLVATLLPIPAASDAVDESFVGCPGHPAAVQLLVAATDRRTNRVTFGWTCQGEYTRIHYKAVVPQ